MENYSYSSYPDSSNSSPRSREVDVENASWDEQPTPNYKVKFLCSYGGKIQPRTHDNHLTYAGGDTKIFSVDRNTKFSTLAMKLSSLCGSDVYFKYQLPGEELDALISVTNDEDLEHMMLEYDRLRRSSAKPARLRLFLFGVKGSSESKAVETRGNDYLFGLEDKSQQNRSAKDVEEMVGQPGGTQPEVYRQVQELQRLQISGQDQSPRYYRGEYGNIENYQQNVSQPPPPPLQAAIPVNSPAGAYWPEQHVPGGQYSHPQVQTEQPVYVIQTPSGIYQAPPPVHQGYYGTQRMVPEVYREGQPQVYNQVPNHNQQQQVYNQVPHQNQQHNYNGAYNTETTGFMRGPPESAYAQVAIDGAGRQVYYMAQGGMVMAPPLQGASAAGNKGFIPGNQGVAGVCGPGYIPEAKAAAKVSKTP